MDDATARERSPTACGRSCSTASPILGTASATSATTTGSPTSARRAARGRSAALRAARDELAAHRPREPRRRRLALDHRHRGRDRGPDRSPAIEHRSDRLEVANHMCGPAALLGDVASIQQADTPERLDRYEARLRAFPAFLEARRTIVARGRSRPASCRLDVVVERTVAQLERIARDLPGDVAARSCRSATTRRRATGSPARVRDAVDPAHAGFLEVLRTSYLPPPRRARSAVGPPRAATGIYTAEIRRLDLARPRSARRCTSSASSGWRCDPGGAVEVAARLGYADPAEAIADRTAAGQNTPASAEDWSSSSRTRCAELGGRARVVRQAPEGELRASAEVEAFREADTAFAFYNRRPRTGRRPGTYYINAYDLGDRALHHVASVTYHEANPGHHFQIALEQEMTERPLAAPVRRRAWPAPRSPRGGACTRAARRRDGPLPRRVGAARDARQPGAPRGAPGHRHRHPRARAGPASARSTTLEAGRADRARDVGDRGRPLHRDARRRRSAT